MLFVVDPDLTVPVKLDRLHPEPVWLLNHPDSCSAELLEWCATYAQHFRLGVPDEELERGIHQALVTWQFVGPANRAADVPAPRRWAWLRSVL